MQITFDPTDSAECALVADLLESLKGDAPKAPAAKPKAAKAAEPEPEPEDEDLLGGGEPTMEDAVAAATKLVSDGKAADVKAALAKVGAKRVSEVKPENIAKFIGLLS